MNRSKSFYCRIEWIAYDLHSGLKSIYWKLLDNYTGENIIHGHEDIPSQGGAKVGITIHIFFTIFTLRRTICIILLQRNVKRSFVN